ncbi:hypothetical protein FRC19_005635, partial [Serendipita sp. 401]
NGGVYSPTSPYSYGEPPILTTTNALGRPTATTATTITVGIPRSATALSSSQSPTSATATSNPLSVITSSPTESSYTRAEIQTIAESLLAHVSFGPYHLACSPVPSSQLRQHMGNHNTNTASSTSTSSSSTGYYINPSSTSSSSAQIYYPPTLSTSNSAATLYQPASSSSTSQHSTTTSNLTKSLLLGPSARRQFEGKEGGRANRENHHPRAKFSIGGASGGGYTSGEGAGERGRGLGRKSVGGASGSSMGIRTSSRRE